MQARAIPPTPPPPSSPSPARQQADGIADALQQHGFVADCLSLADTSILPVLQDEIGHYDAALQRLERDGIAGVPYLTTAGVRRLLCDAALGATVNAALGTDQWVMWGANMRRGSPNQAHRWHVDLESVLWPSVTLALALEACTEDSATWFIPGTHRLRRGPGTRVRDCTRTSDVLAAARASRFPCDAPRQAAGFSPGRFCLFDAATWHKGAGIDDVERTVLYLHVHRATERRIPLMIDYRRGQWSREAAPWVAGPGCREVNPVVNGPPLGHRLGRLGRLAGNVRARLAASARRTAR